MVVEFDVGVYVIGKKIVEEVVEVWMVVEFQSDDEIVVEIFQLFYYLQVMMFVKGFLFDDV